MINPYNLPHPELRDGQKVGIPFCLEQDGVGIMEAVCGSGKTGIASAVASKKTVIALCKTKNLQQENYGDTYGFDVLFGRANYRCVHPGAVPGASAAECLMSDRMHRCPVASQCKYLQQKHLCKNSPKVSLNYAYFLSSMWPKENPPQVLFLDEAHEIHHTVVGWAGCTITEKQRIEWDLPPFPTIKHRAANVLLRLPPPVDAAIPWLRDARDKMDLNVATLRSRSRDNSGKLERLRKGENLARKLHAVIDALHANRNDWYVRSGNDAQRWGDEYRPAFVCKPLTAKYAAPEYFGFNNGQTSVLMSATIGNLAAFTDELGIREHDSLVVPSAFPPESQPVHILDCPAMGVRASQVDFDHQADEVAKAILAQPKHWSGLVLTTRKTEARLLADRLARRGLQGRVWVTPGWNGNYEPTDKQARAWEQRKRKVPNSICVTWSFWVGFDGLDEKILIAAKAPFPRWGSEGDYEASWRAYSLRRYRWQAGCTLAQGLGRTRRGRDEDYDLNGNKSGFVAIADQSWSQVKGYLPVGLRESIVK